MIFCGGLRKQNRIGGSEFPAAIYYESWHMLYVSHAALEWNPQIHYDAPRPSARRRPTGPKLRWTDELRNHAKDRLQTEHEWNDVCSNPDFWKLHESTFINHDVN